MATQRAEVRSASFTHLDERSRQSLAEPARSCGREVGDLAVAGTSHLLQGQLDPEIATSVAVIEDRHRPGAWDLVFVTLWVVIAPVLDQFFHRHILSGGRRWRHRPGSARRRICHAGQVDGPAVDAFESSARWFLEVSVLAVGHYDRPGLGEWSVRDLLGHASRSLSTVELYLEAGAARPGAVHLTDAVAYYQAIGPALADSAAVVERGRAAGAALGGDPTATLSGLVARVPRQVRASDAGALLATPFGTMTLEGYLPTRTLELTVHTCDLAAALGVSAEVPRAAAAETFAVIGGLAAAQGKASTALLALTGRAALTAGYSVF